MKKLVVVLIAFLFISFAKTECAAKEEKDTLKILLVGNSYTHFENMPQIISIISDSSSTKLLTKKKCRANIQHSAPVSGVKQAHMAPKNAALSGCTSLTKLKWLPLLILRSQRRCIKR